MSALITDEGGPLEARGLLRAGLRETARKILDAAKTVSIHADDGYEAAARFCSDTSAVIKDFEADRVKTKAPFLAVTQGIDAYYGEAIRVAGEAVRIVKDCMLDYDARKKREREAEERLKVAERRRLEDEARTRLQAEEEARRQAQEAADKEARAKLEAAQAAERREREARLAAEAKSRGDAAAAEAAEKRAQLAEAQANQAKAQAQADRAAAIEARRKMLRAEAATNTAVEASTQIPPTAPAEPVKVSGVARKTIWKWRLREGKVQNDVPRQWLILDAAAIQAVIEKLKDKALAETLLGDCFEVYSEQDLSIGKGKK